LQGELGHRWAQFQHVLVRDKEEMARGPYIDDRGRSFMCSGIVVGPSRYNPYGRDYRRSLDATALKTQRLDMEADVVERLAGIAAEARYRRMTAVVIVCSGGADDWESAGLKISDFVDNDGDIDGWRERLYHRATRLVSKHWAAILAVAKVLVARRRLDAAEVLQIIDEHANKSRRWSRRVGPP
jgi:hypothetical protein